MNAILQVILQVVVFGIGPIWAFCTFAPNAPTSIGIVFVLLFIVYYIIYLILIILYEIWKWMWNSFTEPNWVKMKFKDWYKLYKVNPRYWDTSLTGSYGGILDDAIIYKGPSGNKHVYFSFFGYCKFLIWKFLGNSNKNNAGKNDSLKDILTDTQEYIENILNNNNEVNTKAEAKKKNKDKEFIDYGF